MKQALLILILLTLLGMSIAHIFNPDWFIKRSGARKGGGLLTEYNRTGFQVFGVICAAVAMYLLYSLLWH